MSGQQNVLFVGLGRLGFPLALRLLHAGTSIRCWDADASAMQRWDAEGGESATTADLEAPGNRAVVLCLPTPQAATDWLDKWALGPRLGSPRLIIDLGTTPPSVSRSNAQRATAWDGEYLDAPMSRQIRANADGRVTVMVGGTKHGFEAARPLLSLLGNVMHLGPSGNGSRMKSIVQFVYLSTNAAFGLGLRLANDQGLPSQSALQVLREGASSHPLIDLRLNDLLSGTGNERFMVWRALKDLAGIEDRSLGSEQAIAWLEQLEHTLQTAGDLNGPQEDILSALAPNFIPSAARPQGS